MKRFVDSVKKALDNENWYVALISALTLPDICVSLESESGYTSGKKYSKWFNNHLLQNYTVKYSNEEKVFLTGNDCYALRCSILHQGIDEISRQRCRDILNRFVFTTPCGSHLNISNKNNQSQIHLDVKQFCLDICDAVLRWENTSPNINQDRKDELVNIIAASEGAKFTF